MLDRTNLDVPLLVYYQEVMSSSLRDNNQNRPAVIVTTGGSIRCHSIYRKPTGAHSRESDPGLGKWFDGEFLPKLRIGFSHHDFARAAIVGTGTVDIEIGTLTADVGILLLPEPDGTYGYGSRITIKNLNGFRLGVLVAGQQDFDIRIARARASLWASEPMGHTYYANECRHENGAHLRTLGGSVRIGQNRATIKESGVRHDHSTFKLKGSHGVYLECLDDDNPCGSLDAFDSSGIANLRHKSSGVGARNFQALRIGRGGFGDPPGNMCVLGEFDCSMSDPTVPSFRLESPNGRFAGAQVTGSAPVIWSGCDDFGSSVEVVETD